MVDVPRSFGQPLVLKPMEREIIALLACGMIPSKVAKRLKISESTISRALSAVMDYYDCINVADLVIRAFSSQQTPTQDPNISYKHSALVGTRDALLGRMSKHEFDDEELALLQSAALGYRRAQVSIWASLRPPDLIAHLVQDIDVPKVDDPLMLVLSCAAELGYITQPVYTRSATLKSGITVTVDGRPGQQVVLTLEDGRTRLYLGIPADVDDQLETFVQPHPG